VTYERRSRGVYPVGMKRKLIIAGIIVAFAAVVPFVVLLTRQDATPPDASGAIRFNADGQLVIQPPKPRAQWTVVAPLVTNTAPARN